MFDRIKYSICPILTTKNLKVNVVLQTRTRNSYKMNRLKSYVGYKQTLQILSRPQRQKYQVELFYLGILHKSIVNYHRFYARYLLFII